MPLPYKNFLDEVWGPTLRTLVHLRIEVEEGLLSQEEFERIRQEIYQRMDAQRVEYDRWNQLVEEEHAVYMTDLISRYEKEVPQS